MVAELRRTEPVVPTSDAELERIMQDMKRLIGSMMSMQDRVIQYVATRNNYRQARNGTNHG